MKKITKILLIPCLVIGLFVLLPNEASAETYGDLEYAVSNGKVTIIDCDTSATNVVIPSRIDGYPVTSISYRAFYICTSLTSIIIPESVTYIGNYAFESCKSLTSITIPKSVTSIGKYAFYNCTSLTSIKIPDSITSIGEETFSACISLTSIEIPDRVTSIGQRAFYNCYSLTSVDIGDSVTSIGWDAFDNCKSLTSIEIPDGVTSIDNYAFNSCKSLTSITIPESVTSIGFCVFGSCTSLTSITVDENNENYCSDEYGVLYNKDKTTLIQCPVGNIGTSYSISDSVTSIGKYAFYNCTSLTSIEIPDSVIRIDKYAFAGCTDLTDVYYSGSEEQWAVVYIDSYNQCLTNATIHYNSSGKFENPEDIEIINANKIELSDKYSPEYLYSDGCFLNGDNEMTTTPEIYISIKNTPKNSVNVEGDREGNNLHNVKINASVSGSGLSFDESSYSSTYQSVIPELKIDEALADLLLLYPHNVDENTFATKKTFVVSVTVSADELESPLTKDFSFTVENYNSYIISTHLDFINHNEAYGILKNNDAVTYANAVKDSWEYGWNNTLFNLVSIDSLLGFNNPYDIVVADVLSEFLGSEQYEKFGMSLLFKEYAGNYESVLTTVWEECSDFSGVAGDISGLVDTIAKDEYFDKDFRIKQNAIEKIFKLSKYQEDGIYHKDDELFTYVSEKIGDAGNQSRINNAFATADKAGQAWKIANTGKKAINNIIEGVNYTTVLNAYCEADKASKEAVNAVLAMMYLDGSSNSRLTSALEKYVLSETEFGEIASKIEIALQTGAEVVYGLYDSLFSAQVESILWHHLGNISCTYLGEGTTLTAASAAGGFLAGWSAGKGISDFLCDGSDKAGEMKKVVILGEIAEYAGQALEYCENMLQEDPTIQNVEYYERMLELFKIIQTQTITHVQKVNESKAYSFIERVFTNRENEVVQINLELESSKKFYSDIRCHGWIGSDITSILSPSVSSVKYIQIKCPVNVLLYSPENELLAQITDNQVVFVADGIVATVMGKTKYIIIPATQEFKIEIVANESGTMNYSVTEYNQGEIARKINFNDISLYEGQCFIGNLSAGYEVSEESYALNTIKENDQQKTIYHSESYSGNDIQTLSATVTCDGEGEARGVSSAICGDYVIVVATPNDGIGFLGWYDSEGELLSREVNYGFIIREDMELVAKFQSSITGDLNGDDEVTDSDAIYLMYHTFFPEDYPINQDCDFDGDGEVTDNDAIYLMYHTFFPEEYPLSN